MSAARTSIHDGGGGAPPTTRRWRGLKVAALAAAAAALLPAAPAFGEGSREFHTGPGTGIRHALSGNSQFSVYARAGETIQLGTSQMGTAPANIRVYAPGVDMATATPLRNCRTDQPGRGEITTRAQELAGPLPSAGGYTPCELVAPADGLYQVQFVAPNGDNLGGGTVDSPYVGPGAYTAMWDITVRSGGTVQPGRSFAFLYQFRTGGPGQTVSDTDAYTYTRTGYEYRVNFYNHTGVNWGMAADDRGLVDAGTGEPIYASFQWAVANVPTYTEAQPAPADRAFPQFVNRVDPIVISGPGGLSSRGYAETPIAPSTQPLRDAAFTGTGGQAGGTNRGAGGAIGFSSPPAMQGAGYTLEIDTNRDGTFGNGTDFVDTTHNLSSTGANSFMWTGRDGAGATPGCGDYQYRIRATPAEVHFLQSDTEASGGMRIERMTLPDDADLGNPLAVSYNDRDPYKNQVITDSTPTAVTNGTSGPGFHAYTNGDGDRIDTWTKLPEVSTTGTLRLLCADMAITKKATSTPAIPGSTISYDLVVRNNGPDSATNVKVSDPLPNGLTYQSSSPECTGSGQTVDCTLGTMAAGEARTLRVTASVASSLTEGTLTNTATVGNDTPDPDPSNNTSTETVPIEPQADVAIVKDPLSDKVVPGRTLKYRLVVTNNGPSPARNVKISDPLAKGLTYVSGSAGCAADKGVVSCTVGTLASGESKTYEITVRVASSVRDRVVNTAKVTTDTKDPDPSNNEDDAKVPSDPEADLSIDKIPSVKSVKVGEQLFYTLLVKNDGPSDADKVVVTDTATTGLTLLSAKTSQGSCAVTASKVTCQVGTVEVGGSLQVLVSARADAVGTLVDQAHVESTTKDPDPTDNDDEEKIPSEPGPKDPDADLAIEKTSNRTTLTGSGTITYTLQIVNNGPGASRGVKVLDTPSLPIKVRSVKSSVGTCQTKVPITCELGTMAPGAKATITVVAQPLAAGSLRNSASVTGDVPDPNPGNNLDGTITKIQGRLAITKVADRRVVSIGGTVSYRIKVTNTSAFALTDVKVCDALPSGLVYASSSPRAKLTAGAYCWTIPSLGAKKSRAFTIKARALRGAGGRKVNIATATAPDARGAKARAATDRAAVQVLGAQARAGGVTG